MHFLNKIFNNKNIVELEKKNSNLNYELKLLQKKLEEKEVLINKYSSSQSKSSDDYSKQWQLMEKNLRNLLEENRTLKEHLINLNKIIPKQQWQYSFLVDIQLFFSANKYLYIKEKLIESGIKYLQDITEEMFSGILKDERFVDEALQKFLAYKRGTLDWEVKTFLLKGDKVTKIYQKSRKFLNILSEKNIEFMVDLENFNFNSLLGFGFSEEDVNNFKQIYESYNTERKI
ncbi:MAG: hypothetical protein ACRCZR_08465 [Cetobacterium sp.]